MGKIIGIDLGTTNSCVSVVENNVPVIIPGASGGTTTPSVVAFSKNGERLVGEKARRQAVTNAERTISSVKRHMGTDWKIRIDGTVYHPQTISAMILMQLKQDAEAFLGEPVTEAVITVPAYFNDVQRQATKDAGKIAGLEVKRIINEPTSAALSYGLNHGEPQKVMVYDLGGGTFDVSIIEIGDGVIEVLSTSGDNHLGGDDFDERITQWMVQEIRDRYQVNANNDFAVMQQIRDAAEQAKKELSASDRTAGPVQNALNDAKLSPAKLDRVLLVGGSTRVPAVQRKVRELTGKEPSKSVNPDECVAKGVAILGSTLQGFGLEAAGTGQDLLLLDVTPLSLSIETIGGVATRLVERNTTLPVRYSKIFSTAAPAGVPQIEVTFDIDANGILKVSAKDLDSGKEQSIVITASDRMSDAEIDQAIRDAQNYAGQDAVRREAMELLEESRKLLNETERTLKESGKQMDRGVKRQIKADRGKLNKLVMKCRLDKVTESQLEEIRQAKQQLENSAGSVSGQ